MTGVVNVSGGCAQSGWSAGPDMPSGRRPAVGVYFQPNGKFYAMGGRASDTAGSDFTHPFEYDPSYQQLDTKMAHLPDNQVNNMACGVLAIQGRLTSIAWAARQPARRRPPLACFATTRSLTRSDAPLARQLAGDAAGTILPGGFAVVNNKLYILGGFDINVAATNQIWEFDPTAAVGAKWIQKVNTPVGIMYAPTCRHRWHHLRRGRSGFPRRAQ